LESFTLRGGAVFDSNFHAFQGRRRNPPRNKDYFQAGAGRSAKATCMDSAFQPRTANRPFIRRRVVISLLRDRNAPGVEITFIECRSSTGNRASHVPWLRLTSGQREIGMFIGLCV